jgi:lactoylglutathione lyase
MIVGLAHPGLTVSNLDAALSFFRDLLQMQDIRSQVSNQSYLEKVTGFHSACLKIGFVRQPVDCFPLEIIEYVHPIGQPANGGFGIIGTQHLSYEVNNLADFYRDLEAKGTKFAGSPCSFNSGFWPDARGVFLYGPDNALFELIEFPPFQQGSAYVKRMHHISLTVSDLSPAIEMMCGTLGLVLVGICDVQGKYWSLAQNGFDSRLSIALLSIPGSEVFIELWQFKTPSFPSALTAHNNFGSGHLCFLVDDIFNDYEHLERAGVRFVGPPAMVTAGLNQGAFAIYFSGFDDYRFELFQKPA